MSVFVPEMTHIPHFGQWIEFSSNKSYHFCQQENLENRIREVESGNPPSFLNVCNGVQFHNEKIYWKFESVTLGPKNHLFLSFSA